MIRLALLLAALSLSGCHMVPMAGLMLGFSLADKALGVTDGIVGLIHDTRPAPTVLAPVAVPAASGEALAGDRQ